MEIKGTLEPEDILAGQWLHMKPRQSFAVVSILLIVLSILLLRFSFFGPHQSLLYTDRWIYLGAAVYLLLFFSLRISYKVKRTCHQYKDLKIEFSDDGVIGSNESGQASAPWADYLKWKEGKKCFLLYLSANVFHVIPKRFFQSEGAIDAFREILKVGVDSN